MSSSRNEGHFWQKVALSAQRERICSRKLTQKPLFLKKKKKKKKRTPTPKNKNKTLFSHQIGNKKYFLFLSKLQIFFLPISLLKNLQKVLFRIYQDNSWNYPKLRVISKLFKYIFDLFSCSTLNHKGILPSKKLCEDLSRKTQ